MGCGGGGDGPESEAKARKKLEAGAAKIEDSSELGDLTVDFEATVDSQGVLWELVVHGEEDGAGATVTVT